MGPAEPLSGFFDSHRLRLHYWDYGTKGKPPLVLIHGGRDHARSWDLVAAELRPHYHVFALDLRGHGNSQWAPGAMYSIPEHVLDLSALCDVLSDRSAVLIGHSLGGMVALAYAGTFSERVAKVVAIEGLGRPYPHHTQTESHPDALGRWVADVRTLETAHVKTYKELDGAVARMRAANPHLSESMARHLTEHGSTRLPDGSYAWKFDPFVRSPAPFGRDAAHALAFHERITCPVLLFRGLESWDRDPEVDGRASALKNYRVIDVPEAGHWVHHDRIDLFLEETTRFLAE